MSYRWAAWPRGLRWLTGIAFVVLVLAIAWALFVPIADWLAHQDVGSAKGPLLQTARDAARGRLLTLGAGLFAAGALAYTARNYSLSRESQVTDRYTKAIEQLGSNRLDVRIGGIYALERIARDSARDHPTVMEVLSAFIREHSRELWPPGYEPRDDPAQRMTRPDVQAALTVIGRRNAQHDRQRVNLGGANLSGADLAHAILADARLTGATLAHARLTGANLTGAHLRDVTLTNARLTGANLTGARLFGADLTRAHLADTNLTSANLTGADVTGANLTGADVTGADVTGAIWPQNAAVPEGWKRDTRRGSAGRLRRVADEPPESATS